MDGYIDELQVASPGERVTVGQPLMTIYTPTLRSSEQEYASLLKVQESGNVPPASLTQLIDSNRRRLQRMGVSPEQISELERTKQPTDLLLVRSPCDGIVSEAPMSGRPKRQTWRQANRLVQSVAFVALGEFL